MKDLGLDDTGSADDSVLSDIARLSSSIGFDVVEIGGFADTLDAAARLQLQRLSQARGSASEMVSANARVTESISEVAAASEAGLAIVLRSVDAIRASADRARIVGEWVHQLSDRMAEIENTLKAVESNNHEIRSIAKQVNILAINAKIEATRAGEAGAGFGTVADAVNVLSKETAQAGENITQATAKLARSLGDLRSESAGVSSQAGEVLKDAGATDAALNEIAGEVKRTTEAAEGMAGEVALMERSVQSFQPVFEELANHLDQMAGDVVTVRERLNSLVDRSEAMVQSSVEAGGTAEDARFIDKAKSLASDVAEAFETGIESGAISQADLFARSYVPIPGSDPEQVMARFTDFTDRVLPPIQEPALGFDPAIVFCAAVDTNGYLPTHNLKFSHPQGPDPVWNAAHCRNRRIFDDRVGLKAGRNTRSFLMQVYRRDMGGGSFALMKDLSVPIIVKGRHWGGLRFAYKA